MNKQMITITPKEELNELNGKYEALEQKYNAVVMENTHYKQHIKEIAMDNHELQTEITSNPRMGDDDSPLPMFMDTLASNATIMTLNEQQIDELKMQLDESEKTIKHLVSDKIELRVQNDKLLTKLEFDHHQKQALKEKHAQFALEQKRKLVDLHDRIQILFDQNQALHAELDKINNGKSTTSSSSNHSSDDSLPETLMTRLLRSFSELSANESLAKLKFSSRRTSVDELAQFFDRNVVDDGYIASCEYGQHAEDIVIEYQEKLKKMEIENQALTKQLVTMREEEKDQKNETAFYSIDEEQEEEEEDMMDVFDEDEFEEMEKLFKECDSAIFEVNDGKSTASKNKENAICTRMLQILLYRLYK